MNNRHGMRYRMIAAVPGLLPGLAGQSNMQGDVIAPARAGWWISALLWCCMALSPALGQKTSEYYTEPQIYGIPDFSFKNNSPWGDGEFLLMRTTFDVADTSYDVYRISVLADQGYHIDLNGRNIQTYVWFSHFPAYRRIVLGAQEAKCLVKGANTLAVYCNTRQEQDSQTGEFHPVGQTDVFLEGLRKRELGLTR